MGVFMADSIIRRKVFWILDSLKGKPIGMHYKDLKEIYESEDDRYIHNRLKDYLNKILTHAILTVDYYKNFDLNSNLLSFPVINKLIIKEQPNQFFSSKLKDEPLHYMRTSGSTGVPFIIAQDLNKRNRVLAELIYYGEISGFELGMRNIYFGVWAEGQKKSLFTTYKQNMIIVNIVNLSEEQLEIMREKLKADKKIKCIIGYASTLHKLALYLYEKGDTPNMFTVETIISTAEKLQEITRKNLKRVFECNVISRYSNMENGLLAQESIEDVKFQINYASYIFELLKLDSNEPANIGEMGRIVITDLFNYATPLIRYDTGDIGIISKKSNTYPSIPVFKSIDGRKIDILYDTKGTPISPLWDFDMDFFEELKQFQFIQEGEKTYTLNVIGAKGIYRNEELIYQIKKTLGEDAIINVKHLEDFPVYSSGKFRQNICNYKRSNE